MGKYFSKLKGRCPSQTTKIFFTLFLDRMACEADLTDMTLVNEDTGEDDEDVIRVIYS